MRSVSPTSSTVDSADWMQTFVASLNEEVSVTDGFYALFALNGSPMEGRQNVDIVQPTSLIWNMQIILFEDYGYQIQVGDVISLYSIFRRVGGDWVKVWTA